MLQENSGYLIWENNIIRSISNNIMPYFLAQEGLSQIFSAVSVRVHLKAKEFGLGSYLLLIWDLTIFAFGGRSLFCREASKVC